MRKVYILGETTFDIIFKDRKPIDAKVGGSQLNTSVSLGRLGIPVSFITQFGNDQVGDLSAEFIRKSGISDDCITRFDGLSRIALAFLNEKNNAEYVFHKASVVNPKIIFPEIHENDILLFGSSFAIKDEIRKDLVKFINSARNQKAIIIYDPNFRKSNGKNLPHLKPFIEENIAMSDILKGSDEDFSTIFNAVNTSETVQIVKKISGASLVYTANKFGVDVNNSLFSKHFPVKQIQPISTIGAGDTFNAGIIYSLYKLDISLKDIQTIDENMWNFIIGNAVDFSQEVCMSYENYLTDDYIAGCSAHL